MHLPTIYLWKRTPFLRLLLPLIAGILLQWYMPMQIFTGWGLFITGIIGLVFFNRRLSFRRYKYGWLNGIFITILFLGIGMLLCFYRDVSHESSCLNHIYQDKDIIIATLQEPLSEKAHSFKATAAVQYCLREGEALAVSGNIILYFKKDSSSVQQLNYGTQLLFARSIQPIKNAGNPGSFNYEQYAAFQGIYQQVFLQPGEYRIVSTSHYNWVVQLLFTMRRKVLHAITTYIPGKKESGLAEALLVGYKDDLDKTLVQSYSNTGVVHIIAISGMHLGLIYWLLNMLLKPLSKNKRTRWMGPLLVIAGLWIFSLMAGGGPSILRSAVMFTCIVIGESVGRKTFIYNSLAASAFILLCINPFWLWDAGFQLSYTALLSIVVFMKPIYHWFYFDNKLVSAIWNLIAVSLAAQVLTTPISIYHFHQFPVYFLITNLLAVPLSSIIVILEIFLCSISFITPFATLTGQLLHYLIYVMNSFIEYMERLPFSLWNGLLINIPQAVLLYAVITGCSYWLMRKNKPGLYAALCCLLVLVCLRTISFIRCSNQQKIIVYNIPQQHAIDFISGRSFYAETDSSLLTNPSLQNYHLNPSRVLHRASESRHLATLVQHGNVYHFNGKTIVSITKAIDANIRTELRVDLIILAHNAPVNIEQLSNILHCSLFVIDASNSSRKVLGWQEAAAEHGLHIFYTADKAAFVIDLH